MRYYATVLFRCAVKLRFVKWGILSIMVSVISAVLCSCADFAESLIVHTAGRGSRVNHAPLRTARGSILCSLYHCKRSFIYNLCKINKYERCSVCFRTKCLLKIFKNIPILPWLFLFVLIYFIRTRWRWLMFKLVFSFY